jgi:hypothetical protein
MSWIDMNVFISITILFLMARHWGKPECSQMEYLNKINLQYGMYIQWLELSLCQFGCVIDKGSKWSSKISELTSFTKIYSTAHMCDWN